MNYIIAIDQSTSATKAMLFDDQLRLLDRVNAAHQQFYPKTGWVEHDALEIYRNTIKTIEWIMGKGIIGASDNVSLAITNQRETVVVWNKTTGKPISGAVVWQCTRGAEICKNLQQKGYADIIREKSGLLIDPYFSASGVQWLLENIPEARTLANRGDLLMGTIDTWLIWKLTGGKVHATDYTNASRTLLFNIATLDWDDELLGLFTIPRIMMPRPFPCDSVFGVTTVEGLFEKPIEIAGVLGDSHGALAGQMCFEKGLGKSTYGTGSSVMINIGEQRHEPPQGLVTSVGFAALGKVFYAFEGNIHCTGATIKWLVDNHIIDSPQVAEALATAIPDNGGVYFVPAFAGLGAPWWDPDAKALICGMTLGSKKEHIVRAALEAIAYQVKDLVDLMTSQSGIRLKELRVDGGPTKNNFLMQFQSDMLGAAIARYPIEEASALGAVIMNCLARNLMKSFEELYALQVPCTPIEPQMDSVTRNQWYEGWMEAVKRTKSITK